MPADRHLVALLRSLQTPSAQQDTPRLLSSASYLLTVLSNPLNLTLLSAQLLSASALWTAPDGLRICVRFLGMFQSAALALVRHEDEPSNQKRSFKAPPSPFDPPAIGGNLSRGEWVKAIVNGADDRSPRWRHLLLLAGLLIGFEGQERRGLPRGLRATVVTAFVKALNLALADVTTREELGSQCIALVLNYSFELLSEAERSQVDYDRLLPILVGSAFFSDVGYRSAFFLSNIEADVIQVLANKFTWSDQSPSYLQLSTVSSQPLLSSMGPLSRLIAHSAERCKDSWLVRTMMDDLLAFTKTLMVQWRLSKLSEVDVSEENIFFDNLTLKTSLPALWKLLRSCLFAITIILRGVVGRVLNDRSLAANNVAPVLAAQALDTLRHVSFIATRLGPNSFSQYTFVYLAAIDILSAYPSQSESFLQEIRPISPGQIPPHPLDRTLDLYFLNTAEHFTLVLPPPVNDELLIAAAMPYLISGGNNQLLEIFEAAHSLMLAVLSSPQNVDVASTHLPFYVDALFKVFPQNLSSRQFRLAFKTLLRITTPPSALSASHPNLAETLLELLHHRATLRPFTSHHASYTTPKSPSRISVSIHDHRVHGHHVQPHADDEQLDERSALILTLVDCLPFLPPYLLEEWLPIIPDLLSTIESRDGRRKCRDRFWEALTSGEMDVDRSQICVAWWTTRSGRELVMAERCEAAADGKEVIS